MESKLLSIICTEIEQSPHQVIPFSRFMELALYHPEHGYYTSSRPKVGKEGDFFTSATVHPVFAETLADAICGWWDELKTDQPTLIEVGGGTGYMMKHMIERIKATRSDLYVRMQVILVEASPYHRELQAEAILEFPGRKVWYSSIEEAASSEKVRGVIVSNEYFDAFPVHIVERKPDGWHEIGVTAKAGELREVRMPCLTEEIAVFMEEESLEVRSGIRFEVNLGMKSAIAQMAQLLEEGYVLTIDYGDVQEQLYHPSRNRGTLMCYYRHQAHEDPFIHIGEQDLTAHVNFSALMKWGEGVGLKTVSYQRQDQFLVEHGILYKAQNHQDTNPFTSQAMKRNRAIQQLILPGGMGGVFQFLVQRKS
ncbi:class I SAM-dependent methyltransferase [Brevibacillus ginsengisoli]|uniref:class I SAM-dependent methyltransferase n=1 Tax=Brevibacillus ginsengisoli TaxID=363854 RepID=UPI003CED52ED